ncbi:MAG: ABC transporter permease [Acidobacteria bacterium]|nr:MAG: ABC transporter permease [Acidobacteriota bacterium]
MRQFPLQTAPSQGLSLKRERLNILSAALFLTPMILILGTFNIFPALYSLYLSLFDWNGMTPEKEFIGLTNYARLFLSSEFWNSFGVTIIYGTGITIAALAFGLFAAVLLNSRIMGEKIFRTLYFLPVITPSIAAGVVWVHIFDPSRGIINLFLHTAGITGPHWLTSPSTALLSVIIVGIWKRVGFNLVIYLAALQNIPRSYYETAALQGASSAAKFRYITLPLLRGSTFFLTVTSLIEAFQVFDLVYIMTNGGPMGSTDVMGYYLYRYGFRYYEVGYASSIAYVMFAILFIATLFQFKLSKEESRQ